MHKHISAHETSKVAAQNVRKITFYKYNLETSSPLNEVQNTGRQTLKQKSQHHTYKPS